MTSAEPFAETAVVPNIPTETAKAIGIVSLNWAYAEVAIEEILAQYLNIEKEIADIITTPLGNRTRIDILVNIIRAVETDENTLAAIKHGVSLFDRNRENRNTILHALYLGSTTNEASKRKLGNGVQRFSFSLSPDAVWRIAKDIKATFHYLSNVLAHLSGRKNGTRVSLPGKLPLPDRLKMLPQDQ